MRTNQFLGWIVGATLLCAAPIFSQEPRPSTERPSSTRNAAEQPESITGPGFLTPETQAAAPRLVKFSGTLAEPRTPSTGPIEMTLALYKDELGGQPLWTEIQNVEIDKQGRYTVLLGATQAQGLSAELFPSGEPRWLAVEIQGQPPQPRALLVGVPYALKAADSEKLAGKPASDFVLSQSLGEQVRQVIQAQSEVAGQSAATGTLQPGQTKASSTLSPQMTAAGPMFPPSTFSGTNTTQIVSVHQNGNGSGLAATTASTTGSSGVVGLATSTSTSNNQNGVYGQNAGGGAGVAGIATNPSGGVGVYGQGANFAGVFGNAILTSGPAAGVFGTTASRDGAGVNGNNSAATGFATGVTGNTQSANGNGVFGNAPSTTGFANGVLGQTASPFGAGVFGNATPVNGQASGVYGQSVNWVGVGGQATATSGSPAYGVWGDSVSTSGIGVAGFEDATSGFTNGVSGTSVSPNGNGVFGVSNSSTGDFNNGVLGINNATTGNAYGVAGSTQTTGFGAGVSGNASATTGTAFGIFGQANSPNGNAIFAHAASPSGFPTALVGFLDSNNGGVAGQFVAHAGAGLILQGLSGPNFNQVFTVDANGNLHITGNLLVDGTKSSTAKLQSGRQVALYAVESPENWFEDFGNAELKGGVAWVPLDSSFSEATNAALTYHVFLTPNGDSSGLYVARKTSAGFEVREHGDAGSNVTFDYRIVVKRRGFETMRMAEVQTDGKTLESSRQHLAQLANSGNLNSGASSKALRSVPPAIRPVPPRPSVPQPLKPNVQVPRTR